MQHPREASRLRPALLNMERGHTAKAAGSFWLAPNVAIQAGIGGADAARHHVVGTKPFWTEEKQGGTDLKTHTRACVCMFVRVCVWVNMCIHTLIETNPHLLKLLHAAERESCTGTLRVCIYKQASLRVDMCREKTEFLMSQGSSPYMMISGEFMHLKGRRVNFLDLRILFYAQLWGGQNMKQRKAQPADPIPPFSTTHLSLRHFWPWQ